MTLLQVMVGSVLVFLGIGLLVAEVLYWIERAVKRVSRLRGKGARTP